MLMPPLTASPDRPNDKHTHKEKNREIPHQAKWNLPVRCMDGQLWRTIDDAEWKTVGEDFLIGGSVVGEVITAHHQRPLHKSDRRRYDSNQTDECSSFHDLVKWPNDRRNHAGPVMPKTPQYGLLAVPAAAR